MSSFEYVWMCPSLVQAQKGLYRSYKERPNHTKLGISNEQLTKGDMSRQCSWMARKLGDNNWKTWIQVRICASKWTISCWHIVYQVETKRPLDHGYDGTIYAIIKPLIHNNNNGYSTCAFSLVNTIRIALCRFVLFVCYCNDCCLIHSQATLDDTRWCW